MSIVVTTLSERVFDALREQIVAGRLGTDLPIRQDSLAAKLGVSKIPVREALARLEQVGLLASRSNRGYFVPPMSLAQVEEICELRVAVEPRAAARGAARADEAARAAASDAMQRLDRASSVRGTDVAELSRVFHVALVAPADRPLTTQLVERLLVLQERYVMSYLISTEHHDRSCREQHLLLEAWLARDEALIEKRLTRHLQQSLLVLKRLIASAA